MVLRGQLFLVFLITLHCVTKAQRTDDISERLNAFTIDLLTATSKEPDSPRNLALSPYTVWTLLSILDEGARGNTAEQLEKVLRIPGAAEKPAFRSQFQNMSNILLAKDQGVTLEIFNSIFTNLDQKLKSNFREAVRSTYGVNIQPTDFKNQKAASDKINKYITQATKNRIKDFIHPEDLAYAQVFVVGALYFKGTWQNPFNQNETKVAAFYDEKQNKLGDVDMMYQMSFFPYSRLDWIQGYAVELPYGKGDKMSMILILPYKDQTLQGVLDLMTKEPFSRIVDRLAKASVDFEGEDVQVYLPKFKVESDLTLNVILQALGITDIFDESKADLLNMFFHYLYVSRLIHRAEIEVDEKGTTASAASGATIINKIPPPKFIANKPFLYFIVNKPTKSIVFAGKVKIPPLHKS